MANQWVMQWIKMGEAQMAALKQLSEVNFSQATPDQGSGFDMADSARMAKAGLATMRQLNEIGADIGTRLFLNQIQHINSGVANEARQSLLQLLDSFSGQWTQQQAKLKSGVQDSINRCMANLELAQTNDDITMVLSGFSNELSQKAKDAGGDVFGLLNSANAASSVWVNQTLDQVVAASESAKEASSESTS